MITNPDRLRLLVIPIPTRTGFNMDIVRTRAAMSTPIPIAMAMAWSEQTQSPTVQRPNADPEIKTPAREELSWADQSYGTPSERDVSHIHVLGAMLTDRIPLVIRGKTWVDSEGTCHRILIARSLALSRVV